jgi:hypothetical protein
VFRAFSRNESLSSAQARPAVKYLLCLKGFSKVEDDVWSFFADCIAWFYDKRTVFAEAAERNSRSKRRRYRARMNNNCFIFKVIVKKGFGF